MWQMIVQGLVGAAHGYLQGSVQRAQIENNNRLEAAYAEATNKVRAGSNAFEAAKGALARYMQSVNNNRRLEAGGDAIAANLINARRREDTVTSLRFEDQIRDAEQLGAQAASAAFAGVGGEVADMVSASTRLLQQRITENAERNQGFRLHDDGRRAATIMHQTIGGLDQSLIFDSIDYKVNVANKDRSLSPWRFAEMGAADAILGTGMLGNVGTSNSNDNEWDRQMSKSKMDFRQAELSDQKKDSFSFGGYDSSSWGTGSSFGNMDYGSFL